MNRPVHFEIHASDPERLMAFYSEVLGWTMTPMVEGIFWAARTAIAVEKFAIPGMGWTAYLRDPDGNVFGLHQGDGRAA